MLNNAIGCRSNLMTAVGWTVSMGWILIRSAFIKGQTKILI